MPHAVMSGEDIPGVSEYREALKSLLDKARAVRSERGIEHALTKADFPTGFEPFDLQSHKPAVEIAVRDIFYGTLATTSFESPDFMDIWNLLDISQIFCDARICEIGFTFWLVEQLLEALLVQQCRAVFDYLELRRQTLRVDGLETKKLIVLRACNELLKRLSQAEDTAFSGRVYLYLFQSLPFGDQSSVNLRGEFHTENATAYDERFGLEEAENAMDVDESAEVSEPQKNGVDDAKGTRARTPVPTVVTDSKTKHQTKSLRELYPIFWSIQKYFCLPTLLFDQANLATLKTGLAAILAKFKEVQKEPTSQHSSTTSGEPQLALKRKMESEGDIADAFNPKYLTSPDLFELEINDLAFRRHILVQGLILMDFLLYQTPKSKQRFDGLKGKKRVAYDFDLSDEDATWATNTRAQIASYLQQGSDGKFYYRLVDTVLARDKNWVYWKAAACPRFAREPIGAEEFLNARAGAIGASSSKKIRPSPMGALNLAFLEQPAEDGFAQLRDPKRSQLPNTDAYRGGIMDDEMDIDMAKSEEEKAAVMEKKTSKTWRTLRLAARRQFRAFDKVEDGNNLDALFRAEEPKEDPAEEDKAGDEKATEDADDDKTTEKAEDDAAEVKPAEKVEREVHADEKMEDNAAENVEDQVEEKGEESTATMQTPV